MNLIHSLLQNNHNVYNNIISIYYFNHYNINDIIYNVFIFDLFFQSMIFEIMNYFDWIHISVNYYSIKIQSNCYIVKYFIINY